MDKATFAQAIPHALAAGRTGQDALDNLHQAHVSPEAATDAAL